MKNIQNNNIPNEMRVKKINGLSPSTKSLILEFCDKRVGNEFIFEPGQFIMVSNLGFGESVLTITSTKVDLPDLQIAVRSVGNNTQALHRLKVGDSVWIAGPYGNYFDFDKMAGHQVLVLAGGIGLAPLRSFIRTVEQNPKIVGQLKVLVGAKSPIDYIYKADLAKWQKSFDVFLSCDEADGEWTGHIGKVTDLLSKVDIDCDAFSIICGPPVMFEPAIKKLKKIGIKDDRIYLMLERQMQCGKGKCQHCTCGDKYVCLDGPTFTWSEIKNNWEAFK